METGLWIAAGYGIVVGIDLEKFLDRVNHVSLMGRVVKRVWQRMRRSRRVTCDVCRFLPESNNTIRNGERISDAKCAERGQGEPSSLSSSYLKLSDARPKFAHWVRCTVVA